MVDLGKDTSCTDSLRTGRFVTGARLVAESLYRRYTTPRGMLRGGEDEANFGFDLTELVGSASTKGDAAALQGRMAAEALKDERISSVTVTVTDTTVGVAKSFDAIVEATTDAGPFALKLAVSEVTVELIGVKEAA